MFYSLLFFIILLGMDPKCLLTSNDLQTRRARCQHQLSFLFYETSYVWNGRLMALYLFTREACSHERLVEQWDGT